MSLCLLGCFLTACGTTRTITIPVTEYVATEITRDRYVQIDPKLTSPVKIVKPKRPDTDTIDIIVALQLQQKEARFCNGKLSEISNISNTEVEQVE